MDAVSLTHRPTLTASRSTYALRPFSLTLLPLCVFPQRPWLLCMTHVLVAAMSYVNKVLRLLFLVTLCQTYVSLCAVLSCGLVVPLASCISHVFYLQVFYRHHNVKIFQRDSAPCGRWSRAVLVRCSSSPLLLWMFLCAPLSFSMSMHVPHILTAASLHVKQSGVSTILCRLGMRLRSFSTFCLEHCLFK